MAFVLSPWRSPPPQPALAAGELHLWRFPLACREPLEALLDDQERLRAVRLRVADKAQAFVTARARLRQILAVYVGQTPESLRFAYGAAGKPFLAGGLAADFAFNLAHSGGWGLCAVTRGVEVGVDLEKVDDRLDFERLAARFFSVNEQRRLQACDGLRRRRLFFRIWTRKEAWLKGKGGGFSDPDQDIGLAHLDGCCTYDGSWYLRSFPVARHYLAALATPQEFSCLRCWNGWASPSSR